MPDDCPLTVPFSSHSSEALNSSRWFFSHMALWEEQPRSMKILLSLPRSACRSRTRSGLTCLSLTPLTISTGVVIAFTLSVVQPQPEEAMGARRTGGFQLAPTGSDFSISDQTEAAAWLSYWPGQGAWRSQLAMNSSWLWVLNTAPGTGSGGRSDLAARL